MNLFRGNHISWQRYLVVSTGGQDPVRSVQRLQGEALLLPILRPRKRRLWNRHENLLSKGTSKKYWFLKKNNSREGNLKRNFNFIVLYYLVKCYIYFLSNLWICLFIFLLQNVNSVFQPGYPNPTFTLKIRKLGSSNLTVTLKPPTDFKDM